MKPDIHIRFSLYRICGLSTFQRTTGVCPACCHKNRCSQVKLFTSSSGIVEQRHATHEPLTSWRATILPLTTF